MEVMLNQSPYLVHCRMRRSIREYTIYGENDQDSGIKELVDLRKSTKIGVRNKTP